MIATPSSPLRALIILGVFAVASGCSCSDDDDGSGSGASSGSANAGAAGAGDTAGDAGSGTGIGGDGASGGGSGDAGSSASSADGGSTASGSGGAGSGEAGTSGGAGAPISGTGAAGGSTQSGGGTTGLGGAVNYAGMANAPTVIDGQVYCEADVCVCNDGIDNDGDGTVDGFDPECTGAYDNDEGTFATGIPGDNSDPNWQDCFFDGNSGAGDDGCRYHTDCLTGDVPLTDADCIVTQACVDFCGARTPPGCDCFGCCEVTDPDGVVHTVQIGGTCDYENVEDCSECVQTADCVNECGECELCAGKTVEDLPASCYSSASTGGAGGASGVAGAGGLTGAAGAGGSGGVAGSGEAGDGNAGGAPASGGTVGSAGTSSTSTGGSSNPPPPNVCDGGMDSCNADWPCYGNGFCLQGCCFTMY